MVRQALKLVKDRVDRCSCAAEEPKSGENDKKLVLVGSPNVGKSVIFGRLTGRYVTVSNYPGTTVELTRGKGTVDGNDFAVIDTPGMYSLLSITEEERVARSVLVEEKPHTVVQVVDAKNLPRMLHLTIQLIEAEVPLVLDLNLVDEAEREGLSVNAEVLQRELGIPVVATVATDGRGIDELRASITHRGQPSRRRFSYDADLEGAINRLEEAIEGEYAISKRAMALLLLQDDAEMWALVGSKMKSNSDSLQRIMDETKRRHSQPLSYVITLARQRAINEIVERSTASRKVTAVAAREKLSRLMMHPLWGIPLLLAAIYGLWEFVGVLGAQVLVDFLEHAVFGNYVNPFVTSVVSSIIPWSILRDLFVGQYGIITLGIRYAVAIILPIVATFFIAFSIIEDTGYLPRLAMLIDRLFKKIGLNGRAVIPIVLGFGCDTMAVMVTRTLETKRERVIASLLLALAIPCSAQMGVILALLAGNVRGLGVFALAMTLIFILAGFLAARLLPGEKPVFYMELPPLRWPKFSNVVTKTYTRVEWYFKEILPLFIYASIFIWVGRLTGLFDLFVKILAYPVTWIGLPKEAAVAFLFGFFRRDYGAAGLYDLKTAGTLAGIPLIVAVVTLALFMPCIAQFSMTIKERGIRMALGMAAFIFPFAFLVGYLLNLGLSALGVAL